MKKGTILIALALTGVNAILALSMAWKEGYFRFVASNALTKEEVAGAVGSFIRQNQFPEIVEIPELGQGEAHLQYTLDENSQKYIEKLMRRHKPDYGSLVAINPKTGEVLTMVSYTRGQPSDDNLAIRASFPAASIFKIVTAAAAIDTKKLNANSVIGYGGGNHTLYRRNVEDNSRSRWVRYITVREAFGRSINTVFAKMGIFYVGPEQLQEYAHRFMSNRAIASDVPVETGHAFIPEDNRWAVAEAASGFTQKNTMSPLQGALMASVIVNDGVMVEPYIVRNIEKEGTTIYSPEDPAENRILSAASAKELKKLMEETVSRGTSRKAFRQLFKKARFSGMELGGKTGSLNGKEPAGRYDWFVGYGKHNGQSVAISVVTIHEKLWRVKSATLAAEYLNHYFSNQDPVFQKVSSSGRRAKRVPSSL